VSVERHGDETKEVPDGDGGEKRTSVRRYGERGRDRELRGDGVRGPGCQVEDVELSRP